MFFDHRPARRDRQVTGSHRIQPRRHGDQRQRELSDGAGLSTGYSDNSAIGVTQYTGIVGTLRHIYHCGFPGLLPAAESTHIEQDMPSGWLCTGFCSRSSRSCDDSVRLDVKACMRLRLICKGFLTFRCSLGINRNTLRPLNSGLDGCTAVLLKSLDVKVVTVVAGLSARPGMGGREAWITSICSIRAACSLLALLSRDGLLGRRAHRRQWLGADGQQLSLSYGRTAGW